MGECDPTVVRIESPVTKVTVTQDGSTTVKVIPVEHRASITEQTIVAKITPTVIVVKLGATVAVSVPIPRTNQDLVGAINGVNAVFTFPGTDKAVVNGLIDPMIYLMGQRLKEGSVCDYTLSESGGSGTGFDTVTLTFAPPATSNLFADYYLA